MSKTVDVGFYSALYSNIDRGNISTIAELERNTSPALDMNYRRLLPVDKNARILDIGCGWGYFLHYLGKNGYSNISGIDSRHHAVRLDFIRKNITKDVIGIDRVESYLNEHKNEYDLIVLQQVIYYFRREDLTGIMQAIKDSLKPGGILIVETFNGSLMTSCFVQNWDYERSLIFTEYSLAEIIIDSGLKLKELFGMESPRSNGLKSSCRIFIRNIWISVLKLVYAIERGTDAPLVPHIFSKNIIAVGQKR